MSFLLPKEKLGFSITSIDVSFKSLLESLHLLQCVCAVQIFFQFAFWSEVQIHGSILTDLNLLNQFQKLEICLTTSFLIFTISGNIRMTNHS